MAMLVDLSDWAHIRITGEDRVRFVHGLSTINVEAMAAGDQRWGAILNPKGRVLSVVQLERRPDDLVVHCEAVLGDKTQGILERYAVMDDVAFARVAGPAHRAWTSPATAWDAPVVMAPPPGPAAHGAELEAFRIVAGMLRYGVDVDEDHFPFETPLARFLDYDKGCYVGQEPVFRVRSQGSAARALRGLVLAEDAEVAPGAVVSHVSRPNAGAVTSVARSSEWGHVGMAYLHRSVFEIGGTVEVGGKPARVTDFPIAI
jgi:folate-binding protein YgfZ